MLSLLQTTVGPTGPLVTALVLLAVGCAVAGTYLYGVAMETIGSNRRSFGWVFGVLGTVALLIARDLFRVEWSGATAPGDLFAVAQTLWGVTLLAAAYVVGTDRDPAPVAWVGAVSGVVLAQGTRAILAFDLTRNPVAAAAIWGGLAVVGIALLPAAYLDEGIARTVTLVVAVALLALVGTVSLLVAVGAYYGAFEPTAAAAAAV